MGPGGGSPTRRPRPVRFDEEVGIHVWQVKACPARPDERALIVTAVLIGWGGAASTRDCTEGNTFSAMPLRGRAVGGESGC